ncbi:uncharacterized protein JN550_010964 [Neoarthrinium moseri]|uniref:uncharacterized protein n=1 Tax=Neoarthrinium moseri TaxID=1658444 RepID=UPI001FDAD89A|nr:uncharacterized protein JN550_010964 [Neoarthrinium moseri]KAI1861285.1 hypothetical protein JN550_010964 [Neoarthrinium moseri]
MSWQCPKPLEGNSSDKAWPRILRNTRCKFTAGWLKLKSLQPDGSFQAADHPLPDLAITDGPYLVSISVCSMRELIDGGQGGSPQLDLDIALLLEECGHVDHLLNSAASAHNHNAAGMLQPDAAPLGMLQRLHPGGERQGLSGQTGGGNLGVSGGGGSKTLVQLLPHTGGDGAERGSRIHMEAEGGMR